MTATVQMLPRNLPAPTTAARVTARLLACAGSQIGYREGKSGSDWNNDNAYGKYFGQNSVSWCHWFVSWAAVAAGIPASVIPRTGYTPTGWNFFTSHDRDVTSPRAGDIVYVYGYVPSEKQSRVHHVGIVEKVLSGGRIQTIEGNALPLHASVLTPTGYVPMGDIAVGQEVVDPEGRNSVVTGVYRKGVRAVYRVTLQDGSTAEACSEHLWKIHLDGRKDRVVTTLELKRLAESPARVRVPQIQPVQYQQTDILPLDPYLLGLLIGEGGMSRGLHFTNVDEEIIESVRNLLPAVHEIKPHLSNANAVPGNWRITGTGGPRGNQVIAALRELGLHGHTAKTKFIPEIYKRASEKDRLALLQGLMDSDGHADKTGRLDFSSSSERLSRDVLEVIRSLGGHAAMHARNNVRYTSPTQRTPKAASPAYRLQNINMPFHNPFRLTRKAERYVPRLGAWARRVKSVEYVRDEEVQCISVSAPSHLFITNDFIATHNTNTSGSSQGNGVYRLVRTVSTTKLRFARPNYAAAVQVATKPPTNVTPAKPPAPAKPPVPEDNMTDYTPANLKAYAGAGVHGQKIGRSDVTIGVALETTLKNSATTLATVTALTAAVQTLAEAKGMDADALTAMVEQSVEAALADLKITLAVADEPATPEV